MAEKNPTKPPKNIQDASVAVRKIPTKDIIQAYARINGFNLARLSEKMGMSSSFPSVHFRKNEINISTLIAASYHLEMNLMEHYHNLLPDGIALTGNEQRLQAEIEKLKKEMEDKDRQIAIMERVLSL